MRTTITLEKDVAQRLKSTTARSGRSFKRVVNDALRAGLDAMEQRALKPKPFKVKPKNMGTLPGINLDNIGELLAQIEGEDYR